MKVRLIRNNGMEKAKAGEVIETNPAHAAFLIRYKWAVPVTVREQIETPEEPKIIKKTTRKLKKGS